MQNKVIIVILVNMIMTSTIKSSPQNYYYRRYPSVPLAPTYNINDRLPAQARSIEERSMWKRNSETYTSYQDDETRAKAMFYNQRRSDNGTFKILNSGYSSREQSDIVFPGQQPDFPPPTTELRVLGDASPCGETNSFCEKVDTYPTEFISDILRNGVLDIDLLPRDDNSVEIGQRFNEPGEESLCHSYTDIYRPQGAENKEGKWLYVVNQENYIQEIKMEVCNTTEEKCKFSENFPFGYEAYCKQKFVYRKLYALDGSSKRIIVDSFKLPSCCTCVVKFTGGIANRSAFGTSPASGTKKTYSSALNRKTRKAKRFVLN